MLDTSTLIGGAATLIYKKLVPLTTQEDLFIVHPGKKKELINVVEHPFLDTFSSSQSKFL